MADPNQIINQALAQARSGRLLPAIAALERLVTRKGAPAEAFHFLGMLQHQAGRTEQALFNLDRASRVRPGHPQFESNFGNVLAELGRRAEARARYATAIEADPSYASAQVGLAGLLYNEGRLREAEEQARRAVELAPDNPDGVSNLASCLIVTGGAMEAVRLLARSVDAIGPSPQLLTLLTAAQNYDGATTPRAMLENHRTLGRVHASMARQFAGSLPPLKAIEPGVDRLRVGYLSADFRDHPVGMFITPALESDETVEVFCYDITPNPDETNGAMRARDVTWRDCRSLNDAALAKLAREDRLDVLVELGGHTLGNRQTALAARMAPVQLTYLGYPATTGNPSIDARIVDAHSDPDGSERWCTERLARLDPCAWCYTAPDDCAEVSPLPALQRGVVTFGSFNNLAKTVPEVLDAWAALLGRVAGSRLVLKNGAFLDEGTRDAVRARLTERGVDSSRFDLMEPTSDAGGHMAAYAEIDIALDTFPYAGTTTTCEAFWMGVPVVTLAGELHAGRVGVSLTRAVGLDECVADNTEAYIDAAAALAEDVPRLAELRAGLRDRTRASALMNRAAFRRNLVGAYREVIAQIVAGAA